MYIKKAKPHSVIAKPSLVAIRNGAAEKENIPSIFPLLAFQIP